MKRLVWLLPFFAIFLYACPFESSVPFESGPVEPIDSTMLGYWYGIVKDGSDFFGIEALDITKESDSLYSIIRYGKAAKGDIILPDTSHFKGYVSYLDGQRFMNIVSTMVTVETRKKKPPLVTTTNIYYIAKFDMRHDTLWVKTIAEDFKPNNKGFHNPAELRQFVSDLTKQNKNIYDDLYSLSYHKIPKPQPLKPM